MVKPQAKILREECYGDRRIPEHSVREPARPIEHVHGEVAAMQMLIASRFSQEFPDPRLDGLAGNIERLVSAVSRMSGYVFMAIAIFGLALFII